MNENEILDEIRRGREEHARECGYDVHVMFERMRLETARLRAEGWEIVAPASDPESTTVIREEPPQS